jgi:GNAT superfamily N-acetyltransferase
MSPRFVKFIPRAHILHIFYLIKELNKELIPFVYNAVEQNRAILHAGHYSLEDWYKIFGDDADPYEANFIIMYDDDPAAWLKINGLNKNVICLSMLVVDDKYKHKGIGKFALQFIEKYAKDHMKSAILIQTTKDNVIATEFYLKHGYKIIREMIYKINQEGYEFIKEIV